MSTRFIRRGVSKFRFGTTKPAGFATKTVTRPELTATTDLSVEIADVSGWMLESNSVAVPDMGSTFEKNIPGTKQASDSSFTFYEDLDASTIETLLPTGTNGYVYILRKGDKPASTSMDIFPVRVASKGSEFSAGNDPARFTVQFNITDEPAIDCAVPAAT